MDWKDELRQFADNLETSDFRALSVGIGIGSLRPKVKEAAKEMAFAPESSLNTQKHPLAAKASAFPSTRVGKPSQSNSAPRPLETPIEVKLPIGASEMIPVPQKGSVTAPKPQQTAIWKRKAQVRGGGARLASRASRQMSTLQNQRISMRSKSNAPAEVAAPNFWQRALVLGMDSFIVVIMTVLAISMALVASVFLDQDGLGIASWLPTNLEKLATFSNFAILFLALSGLYGFYVVMFRALVGKTLAETLLGLQKRTANYPK